MKQQELPFKKLHPRAGDRVRVKATGETGQIITTAHYDAMKGSRGKNLKMWAHTRWVYHDVRETERRKSRVVGYCPGELEVIERMES